MTRPNAALIWSIGSALFISGAAFAGDKEWRTYAQEANGNVHFYDASDVEETGDLRTVWNRIRYKTSVMGAASYQSLLEIDCSENTERILQRTFFSDKDWLKPAMSTDTKKKPKRSISEGSASARLLAILCDP